MNKPSAAPMCEAFALIADYAIAKGWTAIGWLEFAVGPWKIVVNGTDDTRDDVPRYHARIVHQDVVAIIVTSPFGGSIAGWQGAEDEFIADMEAAIAQLHQERADEAANPN